MMLTPKARLISLQIAAALLAVAAFSPPPCRAKETSDTPLYYRQAEAGKPVTLDCEVAVYG